MSIWTQRTMDAAEVNAVTLKLPSPSGPIAHGRGLGRRRNNSTSATSQPSPQNFMLWACWTRTQRQGWTASFTGHQQWLSEIDIENDEAFEEHPTEESSSVNLLLKDSLTEGDDHNEATQNAENEELEKKNSELENNPDSLQTNSIDKPRRKKKKKKSRNNASDTQGRATDDIDSILQEIQEPNGFHFQTRSLNADTKPLLYVEHRNLNPETELKRYFGARAVLGEQRLRQRHRTLHRSTWLTTPKHDWPRYTKTGISMQLLETKGGTQHFTFEHSRDYQQAQFKFLDAVNSMDPNNILALLHVNPHHIDSLLQLSDICQMQEDQEMARDLIEKALYCFESAFHPAFSLTSGNSRLDYRRAENRSFFLALYKHMIFLEKRGCPRTALEFCKLIRSLDPDRDPLCALLMIDLLALRAREYGFLIRLFEEWEFHLNLSQLPNFAFSVPLAYYYHSQRENLSENERTQKLEQAKHLIQKALIVFPSVLMPLLDKCGVQADQAVLSHNFFGFEVQTRQPSALKQLVALFVGRNWMLWKDAGIMTWLEENVKEVLRRVDAKDPLVQESETKRRIRYQNVPRNIYRHIILSEIKEAIATLPPEVTAQPVMGYDPLPPLDGIITYTRPERENQAADGNTLSLFFRSLLPNFNLQEEGRQQVEGEGAEVQHELNQGVNRLMAAMRDMLANIRFQEPPQEEHQDGDGEWD
ncbi:ribosome quality control complex subunit TCF25 isoform X2 [Narcine bancroftii]|uniref:ribosome quality control complex subunit TCF25 isoform X2 n=1 Tax=Narcine bancroftii TaxID=1343680 RepID=UPI003831D2CE